VPARRDSNRNPENSRRRCAPRKRCECRHGGSTCSISSPICSIFVDVRAVDLDADRRADAGGEHVHAVAMGMVQALDAPGMRRARSISIHQLVLSRCGRPDVAQDFLQPLRRPARVPLRRLPPLWSCGFRTGRGLHHRKRRGIGGRFRAARFAEHALNFRKLLMMRSWTCSSRCASVSEMPGSVVGM
jgi:hypothetical protein